jgi:general secretion pathway protein C
MAQVASWCAVALFSVLSTYFGYEIVSESLALSMPAAVAPAAAPALGEAATSAAGWEQRKVIVDRNLFHSATLAPPTGAQQENENLAKTELPLKLLGTAATGAAETSWAVIEDIQQRETLVVHVEDEIRDGASVERIERRRLVLNESGALRELSLDAEDEDAAARKKPRRGVRGRPVASAPAPPSHVEVDRQDLQQAVRNPASLFQMARILPKYENGQIVGLQVHDPKAGGLFEKAGIQNGEVITQVNGLRIGTPEDSRKVMTDFAQGREWTVQIEGPAGSRTVTLTLPEGQ